MEYTHWGFSINESSMIEKHSLTSLTTAVITPAHAALDNAHKLRSYTYVHATSGLKGVACETSRRTLLKHQAEADLV